MNNFFKNLIERHAQLADQIKPRLPGIYESDWNSTLNFGDREASQLGMPEREENSDPVQLKNELISKTFRTIKDSVSQKNTISKFESPDKNPQLFKERDQSLSVSTGRSFQEKEKSTIGKTVPKIKNEIQQNLEKNSVTQEKNQKADINVFNIKPESGVTHIHHNIEKSKYSDNDKTGKSIQPEKQLTTPEKKVFPNKNKNDGMGVKLPNRFNQWMNEPVKQSQSKPNEITASQTIKVNIGSIEVKAIMETNRTPVSGKPAFKPKLNLEDYLNQRNGGKR